MLAACYLSQPPHLHKRGHLLPSYNALNQSLPCKLSSVAFRRGTSHNAFVPVLPCKQNIPSKTKGCPEAPLIFVIFPQRNKHRAERSSRDHSSQYFLYAPATASLQSAAQAAYFLFPAAQPDSVSAQAHTRASHL